MPYDDKEKETLQELHKEFVNKYPEMKTFLENFSFKNINDILTKFAQGKNSVGDKNLYEYYKNLIKKDFSASKQKVNEAKDFVSSYESNLYDEKRIENLENEYMRVYDNALELGEDDIDNLDDKKRNEFYADYEKYMHTIYSRVFLPENPNGTDIQFGKKEKDGISGFDQHFKLKDSDYEYNDTINDLKKNKNYNNAFITTAIQYSINNVNMEAVKNSKTIVDEVRTLADDYSIAKKHYDSKWFFQKWFAGAEKRAIDEAAAKLTEVKNLMGQSDASLESFVKNARTVKKEVEKERKEIKERSIKTTDAQKQIIRSVEEKYLNMEEQLREQQERSQEEFRERKEMEKYKADHPELMSAEEKKAIRDKEFEKENPNLKANLHELGKKGADLQKRLQAIEKKNPDYKQARANLKKAEKDGESQEVIDELKAKVDDIEKNHPEFKTARENFENAKAAYKEEEKAIENKRKEFDARKDKELEDFIKERDAKNNDNEIDKRMDDLSKMSQEQLDNLDTVDFSFDKEKEVVHEVKELSAAEKTEKIIAQIAYLEYKNNKDNPNPLNEYYGMYQDSMKKAKEELSEGVKGVEFTSEEDKKALDNRTEDIFRERVLEDLEGKYPGAYGRKKNNAQAEKLLDNLQKQLDSKYEKYNISENSRRSEVENKIDNLAKFDLSDVKNNPGLDTENHKLYNKLLAEDPKTADANFIDVVTGEYEDKYFTLKEKENPEQEDQYIISQENFEKLDQYHKERFDYQVERGNKFKEMKQTMSVMAAEDFQNQILAGKMDLKVSHTQRLSGYYNQFVSKGENGDFVTDKQIEEFDKLISTRKKVSKLSNEMAEKELSDIKKGIDKTNAEMYNTMKENNPENADKMFINKIACKYKNEFTNPDAEKMKELENLHKEKMDPNPLKNLGKDTGAMDKSDVVKKNEDLNKAKSKDKVVE